MMQLLNQEKRRLLMLAGLGMVAGSVLAAPTAPQPGVEYQVLKRPQPVDGGKKIEITEFFGYFCPHCFALEPLLAEWVKKQGDNIVFKRMPVNFHDLVSQQKLYFTLETMGKADEYHMKAFNAFHVDRNRLQSDADVMEFVSKSGLDKQKFTEIYNSAFSMSGKLSRATQLATAYQIDGVPSLAIDGRFVTSPVMAVTGMSRVNEEIQNRALIQVLDAMVAKIQKERSSSAAHASTPVAPAATTVSPAPAASKKK
ncbi:thiol:disulfide interchange protein DsbA/DsbL [Undibacterium sp. TS12]|uniref:thiol:disulfide interchange protein DsbA/DsbL n=1 Tax=Undibacterium sp. TS12 TaxID=2908202 RepID=UPI001F4C720A|nr:thiol:disulfide interchange protein DsbA/DsbL [Undibacterium sp. TS12]MCH8621783.1 thiol:disulfide interchange protein DsbA/DsbL [Undibacterium sp. TS12]